MSQLKEILVIHPQVGMVCQGDAVKIGVVWQIKEYKAVYHPLQTRHIKTLLGCVTADFSVWVKD